MTSSQITSAAPMVLARGINDVSGRPAVVESPGLPTHLPKIYLYTQWGPDTPQHVNGAHRTNVFGLDSFDLRKAYANHQTVLSNVVEANGGSQVIQRILPADRGPRANLRLNLDIVAEDIVQISRNQDGTYVRDILTGEPVVMTQPGQGGSPVPVVLRGYKAKWTVTTINTLEGEGSWGAATITQGDVVSSLEQQSQRFPVLDFQASCYGEYGNNAAVRLWAPTEKSSDSINSALMADVQAYPYRLAVLRRPTARSTPALVATQGGDQYIEFVLKPGALTSVNEQVHLSDKFPSAYRNTEDTTQALNFGDFGALKIYWDNIDEVLSMVHTSEAASELPIHTDFTQAAADRFLFNLFSGINSQGEPYYTYSLDTTSLGAVALTETTNLYAKSGADGTMSNVDFSAAVSTAVAAYANPNSVLQDDATHPESIIYDTGFADTTKRDLCQFISLRKDTALVLSTYVVGGADLTPAQELSKAVLLKSYLELFAESDYYGTSVRRGAIVGRYGELVNSPWKGKLPLTIEWAAIFTKMMGSADGVWKSQWLADSVPNTMVTMFKNVNSTVMPAGTRNANWAAGLNWVQAYDESKVFFPAMRGICSDDTSIFTSFITTMCAVELQKVGNRTWRFFTGKVSLTSEQLVDRVNRKVEDLTVGRFCNLYRIVPDALLTANDEQAGYRWTLPITLYANNMKTVMTLDVVGRRMSDLTTQ